MRDNLIALGLLVAALGAWTAVANANENLNNKMIKDCVQHYRTGPSVDDVDWTKASACYSQWRIGENKKEYAELRDFLKHNPRYMYPGQSNNKCWGKPRENPFESAYIRHTRNGFEAGVSYKDKMPAGCFETAPWDNRDANK
jgi:hypothetical protein